MSDNPSKALWEALYRVRATLAEGSRKCSEFGGAEKHTGALMAFQQIDRLMQEGVEDIDRVLIEHEQKNIVPMWHCRKCGSYEFEGGEDDNHCCFEPMEKVRMERIT